MPSSAAAPQEKLQAVVLAGGLATRMHPHTLTVPKAMLEVAGRPFVDWQIERLVAAGYRDVVMCIAHLGDRIRDHVGDGARFGARVVWSEEGPKLLGTAGALRAASPYLDETFLVTYGDSYLPFDYAAPLRMLRDHADCDGVMAVFKNEGRWDASNVVTDGEWVLRYEKAPARATDGVPSQSTATATATGPFDHIDYGATALRRDALVGGTTSTVAGLDALQTDLAARKRLRAYVARERFFEIGSHEGLAELDRHLRTRPSP